MRQDSRSGRQQDDRDHHKLTGLTPMWAALANLVQQCDAGLQAKGCPIIQVLAQE